MKARMFLIICLFVVVLAPAFANIRQLSDGTYLWTEPVQDPRVSGGIRTRGDFQNWFLGEGGQNDGRRIGVPGVIQTKLNQLVASGQWECRHQFVDETWGDLTERTALRGSMYKVVTFGDGHTYGPVKLGFDADVYRVETCDKFGLKWRWDTFVDCGNAGLQTTMITIYVPKKEMVPCPGPQGPRGERGQRGKPGPEGPQGPQGEAILAYYYPPVQSGFTMARTQDTWKYLPGLSTGAGILLGEIFKKVPSYNFDLSASATGGKSTASGGNAVFEAGSVTSGSTSSSSSASSASAAAAADAVADP